MAMSSWNEGSRETWRYGAASDGFGGVTIIYQSISSSRVGLMRVVAYFCSKHCQRHCQRDRQSCKGRCRVMQKKRCGQRSGEVVAVDDVAFDALSMTARELSPAQADGRRHLRRSRQAWREVTLERHEGSVRDCRV